MSNAVQQLPADPRPRASRAGDTVTISGHRCRDCRYPMTQEVSVCMACRGEVEDATFATEGEVWASTCLRVRVPGHQPPFAVAYVVLDDGPRVLVHTPGDQPLPPGSRARVSDVSESGDLVAEPVPTNQEVAP
jgi:uncharacterized OB-fold protein